MQRKHNRWGGGNTSTRFGGDNDFGVGGGNDFGYK